jgi:molybdopterin-guanine dinucleotide biosynthesis protein A
LKKLRDDITAFILSGGKSSRMGTNKALLNIDGKSLIQRIVELLDTIIFTIVISSNEPQLYKSLEKKIIKDIYPGRGPLSGIHSVLTYSNTERNLIISCDMPFINKELINYLCNYESDKDIIILKADGRIQPLCGIYSKKVLPIVELHLKESVQKGSALKGSIYELMDRVPTEIIEVDRLDFYSSDLFFNINTPEDYNYAKKILEA